LNEKVQLEPGRFGDQVIDSDIFDRAKESSEMRRRFVFCDRHRWMSGIEQHDEPGMERHDDHDGSS
jgi:hypothetical protein